MRRQGRIGCKWAEEEDTSVIALVGRHGLLEHCFQTRPYMTNDVDLIDVKDGRMWMGIT